MEIEEIMEEIMGATRSTPYEATIEHIAAHDGPRSPYRTIISKHRKDERALRSLPRLVHAVRRGATAQP